MPAFKVLRRNDAFIDYVALIDADTPEEACRIASERDDTLRWVRHGEAEHDARAFFVLDAKDREIGSTERGDFS
jgi:hypothetical protein